MLMLGGDIMMIKCSTGEVVYNYKDYLSTKHWQIKRNDFKRKFINECCMCQSTIRLNLHHMTYENIGAEKLEDLCFLCSSCHGLLHKQMDDVSLSMYLKSFNNEKRKNTKIKCNCKECLYRNGTSCNFNNKIGEKKYCIKYVRNIDAKKKQRCIKREPKQQIVKNTTLENLSQFFDTDFRMELLTVRYKNFNNGCSVKLQGIKEKQIKIRDRNKNITIYNVK